MNLLLKKKKQKEEKVSIDDILSVITGETLVEEKLEKVHAVLKDLLEMPEEEWGFLSSAATKKGKTKEWKKEELR